ncbi:lipase member M-like isoform X1 [Heteronotia binoei]|uniref:lipase member M-like isoform X1 n=1 Tax=Heteronotia binoei TaxID=13085 RepID=UPI00292F6897|nr:lipase member M-like isoform X1 [Heteronotia binoei]XP_060097257.1 lipase member M-like isoform X1 [Heteronotia binoei]
MWSFILMVCLSQEFVQSKEHMRRKRAVDPEAFMNINELIRYRGYPSEEYEVITDDGYILSINRIPFGIKKQGNSVVKPVVFLQHGLLGDGSNWVTNLDNNSLGFVLADAGYDVWIGNSRGNVWSRRHQNMSIHQEEFWAFSFDEMAKYDLPAVLNFILQTTGQGQLYYIGYSQGAAIGFIAFSAMPELAQKVKMFLALAPVTRIKYARSPAIKLMSLPEKLLRVMLGKKEFLPQNKLLKKIIVPLCGYRLFSGICGNVFFFLGGYNMANMNMSRVNVYVARTPAGTSAQNIFHWSQIYRCGLFKGYDWGREVKNKEKHSQFTPPIYKIEDMNVPTAVWTGGQDLLSDPEDVAILVSQIKNLVFHKAVPKWAHLDFIWGLDAPQNMYNEIIALMRHHV